MAKKSKADTKADSEKADTSRADTAKGGSTTFTEALRARRGFRIADVDPRSTPGFDGDKADGQKALAELAGPVGELQERLFAESKGEAKPQRSVLLVVQGMDTSGKGGIMRHVVGAVDPQGVDITAFKAPSAEEKKHDFLWRIRNALPTPGKIRVFDRSQYEDVLVVRVHDLVPEEEWSKRYDLIKDFEREVAASGTRIIKVMLHISKDEQRERLAERLERPDKHWKYNPGDLDERARWDDYMEAYEVAIGRTSLNDSPWFVVPADRKWYARLAVMGLLHEALADMDPQWPTADFDPMTEMARLANT